MVSRDFLVKQAETCLQLARGTTDPYVSDQLRALAAGYQAEAEKAGANPRRMPTKTSRIASGIAGRFPYNRILVRNAFWLEFLEPRIGRFLTDKDMQVMRISNLLRRVSVNPDGLHRLFLRSFRRSSFFAFAGGGGSTPLVP